MHLQLHAPLALLLTQAAAHRTAAAAVTAVALCAPQQAQQQIHAERIGTTSAAAGMLPAAAVTDKAGGLHLLRPAVLPMAQKLQGKQASC
jgi:hypothetical protein